MIKRSNNNRYTTNQLHRAAARAVFVRTRTEDHTIKLPPLYLRGCGPELTARDREELEGYYDVLRSYYGIPAGEPVFPPKEANEPRSIGASRSGRPSRGAKNGPGHPWRTS